MFAGKVWRKMFKRAASVFLLGSLSFAVSSMQVSASVPMFLDSNIRLTEFLPRRIDGVGSAVNLSESVRNDSASSMQVSASLPMQRESNIRLEEFLFERSDGVDYTMTFGESTHNIISYRLNLQCLYCRTNSARYIQKLRIIIANPLASQNRITPLTFNGTKRKMIFKITYKIYYRLHHKILQI